MFLSMAADIPSSPASQHRWRHWWHRFGRRFWLALWPQWPLALALMLSGALNILTGLKYNLIPFHQIATLSSIAKPLAVLGSSTQIILGIGLVLVGIGLFWRLTSAWAFAVLLLAITVGVDLVQGQWGPSLGLSAAILLALLILQSHFTKRSILANYLISLISILAILAYGTFGTYLLGANFKPKIHDLISAFYFTVITLSTVGYGDIVPATPEARLFAISLLVVGLSVFATVIISALGPVISQEMNRLFYPRRKPVKPKNHVILVGEGPIATNTASELADRDIAFVHIIGPSSDSLLPPEQVVHGDPNEEGILRQAGIDDARLLIAARDDDLENAFIALVAKDLNPQLKVLAVASSAQSIRRLQLARADLVFSPAAVGSRLLANLVEGDQIAPEFQDLLQGQVRNG